MEREGSVASWRGEALVDRACLIIGRDPREAMAWIVRERRLSRGIAQRVRLTLIHDDGALDDAVRDAAAEGPAQWVRVAGEIRAGDLLIVLPPDNLVEGERIRFVDDREATGATARVEVREATDPRLVHAARSGGDR